MTRISKSCFILVKYNFPSCDFNLFIAMFTVKSVIKKYDRALENFVESSIAYKNLTNSVPPGLLQQWKDEITVAEASRNTDPTSMDIMHSKVKTAQSVDEILADIRREDGLSDSQFADDGTATDWLVEGLQIEVEQ